MSAPAVKFLSVRLAPDIACHIDDVARQTGLSRQTLVLDALTALYGPPAEVEAPAEAPVPDGTPGDDPSCF